MRITINVKESYLKIISSLSVNFASGIILTLSAINDNWILSTNIIIAIILLVLAVKIEDTI